MTRTRPRPDAGFTLLEVMVTIAVMGALMGMAVGGFQGWSQATEQKAFSDLLRTEMRQAQLRAIASGVDMCVRFDVAADTWQVQRGSCTEGPSAAPMRGPFDVPAGFDIVYARFFYAGNDTVPGVTFESSGSAQQGYVEIARREDARMRVNVQRLTGRVQIKE